MRADNRSGERTGSREKLRLGELRDQREGGFKRRFVEQEHKGKRVEPVILDAPNTVSMQTEQTPPTHLGSCVLTGCEFSVVQELLVLAKVKGVVFQTWI